MDSTFNTVIDTLLPRMSAYRKLREEAAELVNRIFPKLGGCVCPFHNICFRDECMNEYVKDVFTSFHNHCTHEDAQCMIAAVSEKRITQLELLLRYAEKVSDDEEAALLAQKSEDEDSEVVGRTTWTKYLRSPEREDTDVAGQPPSGLKRERSHESEVDDDDAARPRRPRRHSCT